MQRGNIIIGGVSMVIETLKCNCNNDGENLEYIYRLVQRDLQMDNNGESFCIKAYGIEVESKVRDNEKNVQAFKEEIKYITPYKYKGSQFLHMLEKNMVSPVHLIDVAEEVVEEYYKDFDKELYAQFEKITV